MIEGLNEAKNCAELFIESMNKQDNDDAMTYASRILDIFNTIKATKSKEEIKYAESSIDEILSPYFDAQALIYEKCKSYLSEKLSEETCKDLVKLIIEDPYWLYFQHLGYGMTIRNIISDVCDDFTTLEYGWKNILIAAIKRKLGLNEKLPLKCWTCKWNDRCGDKVCQQIYSEDMIRNDEGINGLTYDERLNNVI